MIGRVLFISLACIGGITAQAQRHVEIGVSNGVTHFSGDLGNFDGAVQWNGFRPGSTITVRDFRNNPKRYVTRAIDLEGRFSWHRVGYDETAPIGDLEGSELRNYGRGLSFRNDLFGFSGHVVLNAYRKPYQPLFEQRFFMFFFIGVGAFYGRPKADLFNGPIDIANRYHYWSDGTIHDVAENNENNEQGNIIEKDGVYETDLYSWYSEGSGSTEGNVVGRRSPWNIGFPMGFGIRYMITKKISLGAEWSYYSFLTDRIDDVSERYATYNEIASAYPGDPRMQELAIYISDPTGHGTDGTMSYRTSRRGNPGLPDAFTYLALEISYKFKRQPNRRSFVSL